MKKFPKQRAISRAVLMALPILVAVGTSRAETSTDFASGALAGATIEYAPNIALALSVEHPTAGLAYPKASRAYTLDAMRQQYIGYFDNTKCYTYVADPNDSDASRAFTNSGYNVNYTGGLGGIPVFQTGNRNVTYNPVNPNTVEYFRVSSTASNRSGYYGLCAGAQEFSGNMLNWASMTAIDIFRQAMTGGNRAATLQTTPTAYSLGDTATATYLRRAKVVWNKNANVFGAKDYNKEDGSDTTTSPRTIQLSAQWMRQVLPHAYAESVSYINAYGNSTLDSKFVTYRPNGSSRYIYNGQYNQYLDLYEELTNNGNLVVDVSNLGFSVGFRRRFYFQQRLNSRTEIALPIRGRYMPYHAVVQVCASNSLESNCERYPNGNYKPTGLMQDKADTMRFAAFGYANIDNRDINGGLLRARMKSLIKDSTTDNGVVLGKEINDTTGQFILNPDAEDARNSNVQNSGVINYLNKFGDYGEYKEIDPVAELYYTVQRYLRNKGFPEAYKEFAGRSLTDNSLSLRENDNFPVIINNWDNPLLGSNNLRENACRPNQIVLIGDTNTHFDNDLPNFGDVPNRTIKTPAYKAITDDTDIDTEQWLKDLLRNEGITSEAEIKANYGSDAASDRDSTWGNSRAGMAALAYWGHVNDIQKDLLGTQTITSFMIDVGEGGDIRGFRNAFYYAAKYGGFNDDKDQSSNKNAKPYVALPDVRAEWTDDANGRTSIDTFPAGTPRTYAIANSPDNMVTALKNAINSAGGAETPTQSNITTDVPTNVAVDLTQGIGVLQSTFTENSPTFSGSLIKQRLTLSHNSQGGFELNYDANCGANCWNAGALLNSDFHNTTNWQNRKVFTTVNNQAIPFNTANASTLTSKLHENVGSNDRVPVNQLIPYILGDTSNESAGGLRTRTNYLMGTVINSTPTAIRPTNVRPSSPLGSCNYADSSAVGSRQTHYAVAANDGMLHLFNNSGREVMAYLPNAVLPKLNGYAKKDYTGASYDRWMNDATATLGEVCSNSGGSRVAKSVLIGQTGRGGNSVYALDVTNLNNPSASNVLWEFTHSDLGLTVQSPVITHDNQGNAIAIVGSGYRKNGGSDDGYIFVLKNITEKKTSWVENVDYYKVKLGSAGVGELHAVDRNGDNSVDAIYVGDLDGKVWKLVKNENTGQFESAYTNAGRNMPLFKADASIVGAPYVQTIAGNTYVVFATGRFFGNSDLPTSTRSLQNYAYGIIENKVGSNPQTADAMLNSSNLVQQEFTTSTTATNASGETATYTTVTNNQIDTTHNGWRLKLPTNMLNVAGALIRANKVAQFSTITPDNGTEATDANICAQTGSTSTIIVNVRNGGLWQQALFDVNGDGSYTAQDGLYAMYTQSNNVATQTLTVNTTNGTAAVLGFGSATGFKVATNNLAAVNTLKRLSWREIY